MNKKEAGMAGKVCIVTGANSGIGKATAEGLASLGAEVVIVCRDSATSREALGEIKHKSGNPKVELLTCDLASQRSIRQAAASFLGRRDRLDVLVNNAGVYLTNRETTEDGLEMTFAVNHLAYFLLTNLLVDVMKRSAPARIVNVSSVAHAKAAIDFDDLQSEKNYGAWRAYGQSKLANILFTYELARRLQSTGVTANCLHPGVISTGLMRNMPKVVGLGMKAFLPGPRRGAATSVYLASAPEVERVTGKYFSDKRETRSSEISYNETVAGRLWRVSAQLTALDV